LAGLEAEATMSNVSGAVSRRERDVEELRADRELAREDHTVATGALDDPEERAGGLLALRNLVEAYGEPDEAVADAGSRGWVPCARATKKRISRRRPFHKSSGRNPVLRPIRASIRGPTSSPSWNAKM